MAPSFVLVGLNSDSERPNNVGLIASLSSHSLSATRNAGSLFVQTRWTTISRIFSVVLPSITPEATSLGGSQVSLSFYLSQPSSFSIGLLLKSGNGFLYGARNLTNCKFQISAFSR